MSKNLTTIDRNAKTGVQPIDDIQDVSRIIISKFRLGARRKFAEYSNDNTPTSCRSQRNQTAGFAQTAQTGSISGGPDCPHQVVWNLLSNVVKF